MQKVILFLATNGGLGYARKAPGTFGTLAGIPFFFLISRCTPVPQIIILVLLCLFSFWICDQAGKIFGVTDDGRIVIDELVGYLVAVSLLPFTWLTAVLAFFWFRFFDITKIFPANWFDNNVKNGVGVVLDDVVAGIYAAIALRLSLWLINSFIAS